jgi:valyl-tRNA synthetase
LSEDFQTQVKVVGLIDIKLEIERINKRQNELTKLMDAMKKKINIPNYETKVPETVRAENAEKLGNYDREFGEN